MKITQNELGFSLVSILTFVTVFSIVAVAVMQIIIVSLGTISRAESSERAVNIAEAGVNYYLWHLNHENDDLKDGNDWPSTPSSLGYGPYEHPYYATDGTEMGSFTLWIKPGVNGSSIASVRSIGKVAGVMGATRTIEAQIGAPSLSRFAVAGNTALWFGNTESAAGPVHSNVGVKMDGPNTDAVTSANASYLVPDWSGPGKNTIKPGVWCDSGVTLPVNCNTRNKTSWQYPVPSIDFNKLAADLCSIKKIAINNTAPNACSTMPLRTPAYIPAVNTAYSQNAGYLITFNDNNTYNLQRVTNEDDRRTPYTSALSRTNIESNIAIPANGIIFVEDNVWVRTNGPNGFDGRVTIASGRLAVGGETNITIVDDVKYADKYNGGDAIGMIAELDVEIAPYAGAPLEVNAAVVSQTGSVGIRKKYRHTYWWSNNYVAGYANNDQGLTFFGSLASNQQWTWSVMLCSTATNPACWAGYRFTDTIYDENLRYAPPPHFPLTSTFDILSWREILHSP